MGAISLIDSRGLLIFLIASAFDASEFSKLEIIPRHEKALIEKESDYDEAYELLVHVRHVG